MLLSMTGHGRAEVKNQEMAVVAEIRAVNNRFLKTSIHSDLPGGIIAKLESLIKEHVARGSINVKIRQQWLNRASNYRLNLESLKVYQDQLAGVGDIRLSDLLSLPGIVNEELEDEDLEACWPLIQEAMASALESFNQMRALEGRATEEDLLGNCDVVEKQLNEVEMQAPRVVAQYEQRLQERIQQLLQKNDLQVDEVSVVREVGIFADRVDISEEITRLRNHVVQFRKIASGTQSNGRKLDFLTQEMLRETNTIGSKANDAKIAGNVVEIKTAIERIREQVQNVE